MTAWTTPSRVSTFATGMLAGLAVAALGIVLGQPTADRADDVIAAEFAAEASPSVGTPVRIAGQVVGQVTHTESRCGRSDVAVQMSIDASMRSTVRADSRAFVHDHDGASEVWITLGSEDAPVVSRVETLEDVTVQVEEIGSLDMLARRFGGR